MVFVKVNVVADDQKPPLMMWIHVQRCGQNPRQSLNNTVSASASACASSCGSPEGFRLPRSRVASCDLIRSARVGGYFEPLGSDENPESSGDYGSQTTSPKGTQWYATTLHVARETSTQPDSATWTLSPPTSFSMDDQSKPEQIRKGSDDPKSQNPQGFTQIILPHILNLYGSRATARDFEIYDPNATFEDPLMCAHGVKQIKSAFYSLAKIFSESQIVEYSVQENETGPGKVEVLIDNKQHYKIFGKDVDVTSLIKLNIHEGKVVRHEDWWDRTPLRNRDTVKPAFVGRLAEMTRRGSMLVTHAMMGFGKDPKP